MSRLLGRCLGVSVLLMLAACATPKVKFKDIDLKDVTLTQSKWIITLATTQPGLVGTLVDTLSYEGYIGEGEDPIVSAKRSNDVLLPGENPGELLLPIEIPHLAVVPLARAASTGKPVPYRIIGKVTVVGYPIQFDKKGMYDIPPEKRAEFQKQKESAKKSLEKKMRKLFK
jgi:hypothetical protein